MATNKSPTTSWIYDIECYPNMFEVAFIPYGVPQDVIDLYISADIAKNKEDKRLLKLLLFIELIMKITLNVRI